VPERRTAAISILTASPAGGALVSGSAGVYIRASVRRSTAIAAVVTVSTLVAVGCSRSSESKAATSETRPATAAATPTRIPRGTLKVTPLRSPPPPERLPSFRAVRIAGANFPAGLAAAPDGRLFYSELWGGRIRVIRPDGSVDPEPWADVNARYGIRWVKYYHGGLTGIAFDPAFVRNHFVYVVTQIPHEKNGLPARTLVVRFKEVNGRGTSPRVLLTILASVFDNSYSLVFGPDAMLYIPSGFLGTSRPPGKDPLSDRRGKILRVTRAGRAPGNNPYGARAPLVWAMGFKNAFDLAFFPRSNLAVAGESGAAAHDEINLVMPGHNYGYPEHEGVTRVRGLTPPLLDYGSDRTSPVGIIYYSGSRYPALRGRFLMCENHGRGMLALRIKRSDPGRLLNLTPLVGACTLDLVQMVDGSVVFSDSQAIYRLVQE
jgi:glucose/arabinose dehydrogenase